MPGPGQQEPQRAPIIWTNEDWIQTHKRFKRTLFTTTKHNVRTFGVIPFIKLQNDIWTTVTVKNDEKWDGELSHWSIFGWTRLFSSPDGHSNILPKIGQENNIAQPKTDKWFAFQHSSKHWTEKQHGPTRNISGLAFHFICHRFWPFNWCLSVVL